MSVEFFSKEGTSYTPKYTSIYTDALTTTLSVWTPTSGNKIVLTDFSMWAAATGTFRIYFQTSDITSTPSLILEDIIVGSGRIQYSFETPVVSTVLNGILKVVGGANGLTRINVSGFEI